MEITIEDGVDEGTIIDTILAKASPDYNFGIFEIFAPHKKLIDKQSTCLIKVDLTSYSGITIIDSRLGFDVYAVNNEIFETRVYKVLKSWIEGTKDGYHTALAGEPTWNSQAHNLDPAWSSGGCEGSGTDRAATHECAVTVTEINSDVHFSLTNATVQDHIDNPSSNNGFVFISQDTTYSNRSWQARSSEAITGNKPYFYMEYSSGWNSNSYYGNRRIASTNSPQRSRRTY